MYELDAESASDAIDTVIAHLIRTAHQRLLDKPDTEWAAMRSAMDASPLLSLLPGSAPLFEVILGRLRVAYERTADCCVAELAMQLTLQAAAQQADNSDKVRPLQHRVRNCVVRGS